MFQDLKEIIELKPWLFHKLKLANVNAKQNTSLKILVVYYFQTCVFSLLILSRNFVAYYIWSSVCFTFADL